jgi:putative ubiquitin-RnfH superfamily antitoxin RatB of RatAB toxin-antitoxin module
MANAEDAIRIEVVAAMPDHQELVALTCPAGVTASEAIGQSDLGERFPGFDFGECDIAVWGKVVDRDTVLKSGDRVEILRPLEKDPREARREIASQGGFMGKSAGSSGD